MSEQFPTFLVSGDRIVEVLFTTWEQKGPNSWGLTENTERFDIEEDMDRIVFELPNGCWQMPMRLASGDGLEFLTGPGSGNPLQECQSHPSFVQAVASERVEDKVP